MTERLGNFDDWLESDEYEGPEPDYPPDEVLFGDPRGELFDEEYEHTTVNIEDVPLLDRFGGMVL